MQYKLLKATKGTTEHQNWPKVGKNSLINLFLPLKLQNCNIKRIYDKTNKGEKHHNSGLNLGGLTCPYITPALFLPLA